MPPRSFEGEKEESLVFYDRSTKSRTGLDAGVRGIADSRKRISGLDIAIAEVCVGRAVPIIRTALGDDVHHAAGSLSVLGVVAVGDDLELLHRFLRDGGTDSIGGVIDIVHAIEVHQVRTGTLSAEVQPRSGSGADAGRIVARQLRIREREIDVVATVDRQILDALAVDGRRFGA